MMIKSDFKQERRFTNIFKFIDDLTDPSYGEGLEWSIKEIFPPGLVLKKEIYVIMRDHFWIYMSLLRIINFTSYYMIRDLMSLFYLTSNIPSKISYSTYGSEILRSARIISSKLVFQTTLKINYKNM